MKPVVQIKDATLVPSFGTQRLMGVVLDYPDEHQGFAGAVTNGKDVMTSPVISINENTVETQRTVYEVQSWLK